MSQADKPVAASVDASEARGTASRSQERPIVFSAPMVRAILEGRKTQTRRVVASKPKGGAPFNQSPDVWVWIKDRFRSLLGGREHPTRCPYGVPGDRLWVRETWAPFEFCYEQRPSDLPPGIKIVYLADQKQRLSGDTYRPSIHMPRWASRLTLEVVSVRVERVREISEADAYAEGCNDDGHPYISPFGGRAVLNNYAALWDRINGKRKGCAWTDNPWVWVVEFRKVDEASLQSRVLFTEDAQLPQACQSGSEASR